MLRPGSTSDTDQVLQSLLTDWRDEESRLQIEIPGRTWAYLMRLRDDLDQGLQPSGAITPQQRMDAIQSLLWPRGWLLRASELESYNPFTSIEKAAPDLLRSLVSSTAMSQDVAAPDANESARRLLAERGSIQLVARPEDSNLLALLLVDLATRAIETEFLQVFPRVNEMRHLPNGTVVVSLELAEVAL